MVSSSDTDPSPEQFAPRVRRAETRRLASTRLRCLEFALAIVGLLALGCAKAKTNLERVAPMAGPGTGGPVYPEAPSGAISSPRGFGSIVARISKTGEATNRVRIATHDVKTTIRDGIARTQVEEVFENNTDHELEGAYFFLIPPGASLARLALWVGNRPVEGEIVDRRLAAEIFQQIADEDTSTDRALLEGAYSFSVALKVDPIPPRGSRKVQLSYDEVLPVEGARELYAYPMSPGERGGVACGRFKLEVSIEDDGQGIREISTPGYDARVRDLGYATAVVFEASSFAPQHDFRVSYRRPADLQVGLAQSVASSADEPSYFVARLRADAPPSAPVEALSGFERVFVLDVSQSQSKESLRAATSIVLGLLERMNPDERFAILACDSACRTFPGEGLEPLDNWMLDAAKSWLNGLEPMGALDLAGALIHGARRFESSIKRQLVYLGGGSPGAGELGVERIANRTRRTFAAHPIDLRFLGLARRLDDSRLLALARSIGTTYQTATADASLIERISKLGVELRQPVITDAVLVTPPGLSEIYPRQLPHLVLGQELLLAGKGVTQSPATFEIHGQLNGAPYRKRFVMNWDTRHGRENPFVARLWAGARIAELQAMSDGEPSTEIIELSRRYHVMSHYTSWLVLENNAMYARLGLERFPSQRRKAAVPDEFTLGGGGANVMGGERVEILQGSLAGGALSADARVDLPQKMPQSAPRSKVLRIDTKNPAPGRSATAGTVKKTRLDVPKSGKMGIPKSAEVTIRFTPEGGKVSNASRVLEAWRLGMQFCYERSLAESGRQIGFVMLRLTIGIEGAVSDVDARRSGNLGDDVLDCVNAIVKAVPFDPPANGTSNAVAAIHFVPNAGKNCQRSARGASPLESGRSLTARHQAEPEGWPNQTEDSSDLKIEGLPNDSTASSSILNRLEQGQIHQALEMARRYAEQVPEDRFARLLLAYGAARAGKARLAATVYDEFAQTEPRSTPAHLRAAWALSALEDEPRMCAHFRTLAELDPWYDEYITEALRCRYRTLGEHDEAMAEARAVRQPGPHLGRFMSELERGTVSATRVNTPNDATFIATVQCSTSSSNCPTITVVAPDGEVISAYTPSDLPCSRDRVAFHDLGVGSYHTILVGGAADARGTVRIRALGVEGEFDFIHDGKVTSIAKTTVDWDQSEQNPCRN